MSQPRPFVDWVRAAEFLRGDIPCLLRWTNAQDATVLAKAAVPLLHVCGGLDPHLNDQTRVVEKRYQELGGQITVLMKEGQGHLPTAPSDPKPVLDFILAQTR